MNAAADTLIGVVVSKLEAHRGGPMRGYIAMLAVKDEYRGRGIATRLVRMAIDAMIERDADEVSSVCFASHFHHLGSCRGLGLSFEKLLTPASCTDCP